MLKTLHTPQLYLFSVMKNFENKTQNTWKYPFFIKKHKNYLIIVIINLTSTIYLCYNILHITFILLKEKNMYTNPNGQFTTIIRYGPFSIYKISGLKNDISITISVKVHDLYTFIKCIFVTSTLTFINI